MELFKLTTPKDDAWKVIETLGHENLVQFLNMNLTTEVTKLLYQDRIKICYETERRILFLINTCHEYLIKINKPRDSAEFFKHIELIEQKLGKQADMLFDAIENEVRSCEDFVVKQRDTIDEIKRNIDYQCDYREVISFLMTMVNNLEGAMPARPGGNGRDAENPGGAGGSENGLSFFAGTIKHEEMERMKKMLFRSTRGLALTHFRCYSQNDIEKAAYLVVFSGAGGNYDRVKKICDSFMGQRFDIPNMNQLDNKRMDVESNIKKSQDLYEISVGQLKDYLFDQNSTGQGPQTSIYEVYKWYVAKEKAIYNALNMLMAHKQVFIGYMWVPSAKQAIVANKLRTFPTTEFSRWRSGDGNMPIPPTSYKANDVITFHQMNVDQYKIATYGEINPAIFQIVTFPFLYAVMYGDWGHGMVFFLLGIVLCLSEPKLRKDPSWEGFLMTRHFWLMMGFFSVYMGLIYNEFFALPADFFGTCYDLAAYDKSATPAVIPPKDGAHTTCVYAFGFDPSWKLSSSELTFTNNIKEKLAVIIAYFHLNFGMVLNALNCVYFGNYKKLIFDICTGFIIFLGLIGYMIVLIYAKWWYPVYAYDPPPPVSDPPVLNISTSPSIIVVLIGDIMGLTPLSEANPDYYQWFGNQQAISDALVYAAFALLPVMLCAIPCIHICCGKKHGDHGDDQFDQVHAAGRDESQQLLNNDDDVSGGMNDVEQMLKLHCPKAENHDNIGEIFIHQVIETIEFVLGCISNTASYLRLWALSLAHGQLGYVFLTLIFTGAGSLTPGNMSVGVAIPFFFIMAFPVMAAVTGVLLMMDALEVFLHTTRLHWVEFMGKFYQGAGHPYKPFSFNEVFAKERKRVDKQ